MRFKFYSLSVTGLPPVFGSSHLLSQCTCPVQPPPSYSTVSTPLSLQLLPHESVPTALMHTSLSECVACHSRQIPSRCDAWQFSQVTFRSSLNSTAPPHNLSPPPPPTPLISPPPTATVSALQLGFGATYTKKMWLLKNQVERKDAFR